MDKKKVIVICGPTASGKTRRKSTGSSSFG